ncbi:MAG: T9SS type A sorting domain-containing protein [Flavobacterium sp. JAD_PAG50586_2]|nr:MAG: T9SS type A sorting domain-containing protein [Flavobacterium sp. JAD_PAG50586_2]
MYRNYTSTDVGRDTRLRKDSATGINRWLFGLMVLLGMLTGFDVSAQISVSGGTGLAATYPSLTKAGGLFAALNATAQTGNNIVVTITADVANEDGVTSLNAGAWATINITPTGGATRTLSGTVGGNPMINLNGADNVTFDGLNTGGNALVISNLSTAATSLTSTIRLIGGATGNTITNCSVLGSATMAVGTNGGNIMIHTDANTANGNDNNTISNCTIGAAGSNLPTKGIYLSGSTSTTAIGNSGNLITNNNFENIFGPAVESAAIYVNGGCNAMSITNNRFYQTGTRTWTTGALHSAINIQNATATSGAQGFTVTGNIIGYASNTQTGTYTMTGSTGRFNGIRFNGITGGTISNINNNTIASISLTGVTSNGTAGSSPFTGIYVNNGTANCNSNILGSQSATGSIVFSTNTTTGTDVYGIFNFGNDSWTTNSNQIGGINITNAGASGAFIFYGIRAWTIAAGTWTATSNLIGGTVANSIQSSSASTGAQVIGMNVNANIPTVTSNTIRNLTANGGTGTTTGASVIGFLSTVSGVNVTFNQNTIYNLTNTNTTAATVVTGLQFNGSTANTVSRNNIYNISAASNSASAEVNGIRIAGGTTTFANNMIALGTGVVNAIQMNGINEPAGTGTDTFYHNSVYVGGSPTAGTANSFAFNSLVVTNTRNFRNNLFINARSNSGATGKNYSIQVGGTAANPAGLTINYNVYSATGSGGVFGRFNALDVASLGAWKTAVGQDVNSGASDPQYLDPTNATTPDLHINPSISSSAEGAGIAIGTVTDDFDGQTRSGFTPTDIGADAGNFTSLPLCTGTPASSSITGVASVCSGTGTTLSLSGTYTDPGITYAWSSGTTPGGPYPNALGTGASQATGNLTGVTYYVATITCAGSGLSFTTAEKAVLVNALPTVGVTPTSGTFCLPGGSPIALTATGASTYAWSGTGTPGLSATTGAFVNASPTTATTITVTGTDTNSCVNTATASLTVGTVVTLNSVTATPSTICSGGNSQLLASASLAVTAASSMAYSTGTGVALEAITTPVVVTTVTSGSIDDGYITVAPASFTFNFLGTNYTSFGVGTNGYVVLGGNSTSVASSLSSISGNVIYAFGRDGNLNTTNAGNLTHGPAAGGKYVFQMNKNAGGGSGGESATNYASYQYVLWGSTSAQPGRIDIIYGASAGTPASAGTIGIKDTAGTFVNGTNGSTTTGTTSAVWPTSGQRYTFAKPTPSTFAWTPSTFIAGQEGLANPIATGVTDTTTYNVTASQGGCSATGTVTVTVSSGAAITSDPTAAVKCAGETATFTVAATGAGLTYQWRKGGVDIVIAGNASAGTATLTLTNVSLSESDTYDVVVTSTCGSPVTSAGAVLTVKAVPTATAGSNAPVCTGTSLNLTGTTDIGTSYSWTGPNGFTSSLLSPSITGVTSLAAGTYSFTAAALGCTSPTATTIVVVNTTPTAVTITPSGATTICSGTSIDLVASGGLVSGTTALGSGTTSTTASVASSLLGPNPLQSYYGGAKQQMIILASELTAMGLTNGSVISSLAVNLSAAETSRTLQGFRIKMQHTALNGFADLNFVTSGFTNVRSSGDYTPVLGWNTIAFNNNNFTWDGASNILIETNFSNNDDGGSGTSTAVYEATSFVSTLYYRVDNTTASGVNNSTTATYSYSQRNNLQFGVTNPTTFVWTPASSGLNTYSGATVTATPAVTTTYTATSSLNGCSSQNDITVTVSPNYTITATSGANGSVTPSGASTVCSGAGAAYTITPDAGYLILDVLVDGVSQGAIGTYTFSNVTSNHTISATFETACDNVTLASATATAGTVCNATTTTLTYTGLAGTNASVTWTQNADGTGATYGTGTPSNPVGPGTYYAYATGDCGTPVSLQVVVTGVSCQATQLSNCGSTPVLTSVNSRIFAANTVSQATLYRYRVAVSSAPSNYFYAETTYPSFRLTDVVGLTPTYGTTYNVEIQNEFLISGNTVTSAYGTLCTVTTQAVAAVTVPTNQCGQTLAAINSKIYVNGVAGATSYSYRIAKQSAPTTYAYIDTPYSNFRLTAPFTSGSVAIEHNTIYLVAVSVTTANGASNYNGECLITTPGGPMTVIQGSQCGDDETPYQIATKSTKVYAEGLVSGATYTFKLEQYDGSELVDTNYATSPINYFNCNMFTGENALLPNTNYHVYVAVNYYGEGEFDHDCVVRTPGALKQEDTMIGDFTALAYPNPFANNFMIDVKSASQSSVDLKVYDMIGRLIEQREVRVSDLQTTTIGDRYPSGVYNVVVSQENSVKTVRVVKR